MKIAFCRLRSGVKYTGPLEHIMTPHYECAKTYMENHPENEYLFYNMSFDGSTPHRNPDSIRDADIVVIFTENEFHYWIPNYIHPFNLEGSIEALELVKPHINGKKVIIVSDERADTIELFRDYTFKGVTPSSISLFDGDQFPQSVLSLLYDYTKDLERNPFHEVPEKEYDFAYWGTEKQKLPGGAKSDDIRHLILKEISKVVPNSYWIGRYSNIKRNAGMMPMYEVAPRIAKAKFTLCFNWMSDVALTSRYQEALAVGCLPLVWGNFDCTNRLNKLPWQRCDTVEEVVARIAEWTPAKFDEVHNNYLAVKPDREEVKALWDVAFTKKLES